MERHCAGSPQQPVGDNNTPALVNSLSERYGGNGKEESDTRVEDERIHGIDLRKMRRIRHNSATFQILESLFKVDDNDNDNDEGEIHQEIALTACSEYKAMRRLLAAGLVGQLEKACDACGHLRVQYRLTLLGKTQFVSCRLGLSFAQLCYLACAKQVMRHPFYAFSHLFPWTEAVKGPFGNVFLHNATGKSVVHELARKGFLKIYACKTADLGPRFMEAKAYAEILDDLYGWLEKEDEMILAKAAGEPTIARLTGFISDNANLVKKDAADGAAAIDSLH